MIDRAIREHIFALADKCNENECDLCGLSDDNGRCLFRVMSLQDIAKLCFGECRSRGIVWLRFSDTKEVIAQEEIIKSICDNKAGDYEIRLYAENTKSLKILKGIYANDEFYQELMDKYGAERVVLTSEPVKGIWNLQHDT